MKPKGLFIVLEGPDRCGKSTQAALLVKRLVKNGFKVKHTREPGGTPFAEAIRKILLDARHKVQDLSELLLYEAARAQHTFELIAPGLRQGKIVISERYTMASLAYQGWGRKIPFKTVESLNAAASGGLKPDLTLVLEMPDREFYERGKKLKSDRLERESSDFRLRVRKAYRLLARKTKNAFPVDASRTPEEIHEEIFKIVNARLFKSLIKK